MLESARHRLGWFYRMRSIYLFISLILFISMVQFVDDSVINERVVANLLNVFVLVAAIAAVGRTLFSFILALLLALPVLGFQWLGLSQGEPAYLLWSWVLGALFYFVTLVYLLRYVFSSEVMTADKLFGAAAAYMLLGLLWSYLYVISQHYNQEAFSVQSVATDLPIKDVIYFSFTTLTSTGYGDIAPLSNYTKALATIEQVFGTLFVAILIARLAGIYPERANLSRG